MLDKLAAEKASAVLPPKKETIGEILKNKRESSGKDIEYISEYLRIKPQYLRALEANRFNSLPGQAYVVGFIKSYASFLGLDVAKIVDQYKAENMAPIENTDSMAPDENALIENPLINSTHVIVFGVLFLIVMFGVYIFRSGSSGTEEIDMAAQTAVASLDDADNVDIVIGSALSQREALREAERVVAWQQPEQENPAPVAPRSEDLSQSHEIASGMTEAKPAAASHAGAQEVSYEVEMVPNEQPSFETRESRVFGEQNRTDSRISVQAKGRVWIKLKKNGFYVYDENDGDVGTGEVVFEMILEPGDIYYVPNGEKMYLTIGNAQALDIVVDGSAVSQLSPRAISRHNIEMDPEKLKAGTAYVRRRVIE
ncbi:MAG: DUF4115 domain-containing protein [Rickettsiales bacterium]|jgi:cytoskeleton protein RodZ|nr:DUF4115 domain-containing protein [Rickettsiales bacterium]